MYWQWKMSKDREKEINYLLYVKAELIKQTKREIKELQQEKICSTDIKNQKEVKNGND